MQRNKGLSTFLSENFIFCKLLYLVNEAKLLLKMVSLIFSTSMTDCFGWQANTLAVTPGMHWQKSQWGVSLSDATVETIVSENWYPFYHRHTMPKNAHKNVQRISTYEILLKLYITRYNIITKILYKSVYTQYSPQNLLHIIFNGWS